MIPAWVVVLVVPPVLFVICLCVLVYNAVREDRRVRREAECLVREAIKSLDQHPDNAPRRCRTTVRKRGVHRYQRRTK